MSEFWGSQTPTLILIGVHLLFAILQPCLQQWDLASGFRISHLCWNGTLFILAGYFSYPAMNSVQFSFAHTLWWFLMFAVTFVLLKVLFWLMSFELWNWKKTQTT